MITNVKCITAGNYLKWKMYKIRMDEQSWSCCFCVRLVVSWCFWINRKSYLVLLVSPKKLLGVFGLTEKAIWRVWFN